MNQDATKLDHGVALRVQPCLLQRGAAHEVASHTPSRFNVNTLLPPYTPLPLPAELVQTLHLSNPWWRGEPTPPVPATRRRLVGQVRQRLESGITPIVAVPGPRGVGKTTMQLQIISDLLDEGVPPHHIIRVPLDQVTITEYMLDPILRTTVWIQHNITPATFNALAHQGQPAYLFFDEIQHIRNWHNQLKFLVDHSAVKVVATGSSALRIERGGHRMAGWTSTVEAGNLSLSEIAEFQGMAPVKHFPPEESFGQFRRLEFWQGPAQHGRRNSGARDQALRLFSERGGYPMAHDPFEPPADWPTLAHRLNEDVIRPVLRRDLLAGPHGQNYDTALREMMSETACRYAGRMSSVGELARAGSLSPGEEADLEEVAHHLQALAATALIRLLPWPPLNINRPQDAIKLCLADHALRASWLWERVPLAPYAVDSSPELTTLAGHMAQSVLGATVSVIRGLDFERVPTPPREPNLDFVLEVGDQQIPVQVNYRRSIDPVGDTRGIRAFVEEPAKRAPFGLLITREDTPPFDDPRTVAMPLATFMLLA